MACLLLKLWKIQKHVKKKKERREKIKEMIHNFCYPEATTV